MNAGCEFNMVQTGKSNKRAGEQHDDQEANADDWKVEHGFSYIDKKSGQEKALDISFEECFR